MTDQPEQHPAANQVRAAMQDPEIRFVAQKLAQLGVHPRVIARTALYAAHFGLDTLTSTPGGVEVHGFALPTCGDLNCIHPEHQIVLREDQRS